MNATRRDVLLSGLLGAGWIGLRSLATGLPISYLLRPGRALADLPACADKSKAQYLILSIDQNGDPINANVPGMYDDAGIVHPADPTMASTSFKLGGQAVTAANPWANLPQAVLDRTCFFHMATMTTIHPDLPKVLKLMGATAGQEMLPSILAQNLANCLGTVQPYPVSLVGTQAPEYVTYQGRALPNLNAVALRDILTHPQGPLTNVMKIRDESMDLIHARIKSAGTATAAQKAYVDSLAQSRAQARSIADSLLNNLGAIASNDINGQIIAAAALIKMNVTPVTVIRIPFGGDNHFDANLAAEATQTVSGVQAIANLMTQLQTMGLQDQVTFMSLNVFGRTLKQLGGNGRNHWADHHVSVLIGKAVKPGVVGGVAAAPTKNDYVAMPIDSKTGRGMAGGDVPAADSLASFGKTVGAAVGLPQTALDQFILKGKVVTGALA